MGEEGYIEIGDRSKAALLECFGSMEATIYMACPTPSPAPAPLASTISGSTACDCAIPARASRISLSLAGLSLVI